MKKIILIALILVVGFSLYGNGNKEKVLLYIRHGTSAYDTDDRITQEVNVMISMLKHAGFKVIIASTSGELIEGKTQKVKPDLKLVDVSLDDYSGLIMPCFCRGSRYHNWHASSEEISLIKEIVSTGKPIAAQKGAIIMLAEAGVLVGKKFANRSDITMYESFRGAIYSGDFVVRDGNIITSAFCPTTANRSGKQDGTTELTKLFIEAIQD